MALRYIAGLYAGALITVAACFASAIPPTAVSGIATLTNAAGQLPGAQDATIFRTSRDKPCSPFGGCATSANEDSDGDDPSYSPDASMVGPAIQHSRGGFIHASWKPREPDFPAPPRLKRYCKLLI